MKKDLKILILEDVPADCELMERELRKGKISFVSRRVESKEAFLSDLDSFSPDIILADYKMPLFDAMQALELMFKKDVRTPFIVVSGSISEEVAVECLKAGAVDYILKDRLTRLGPAVARALETAEIEKERESALEALRRSEQKYRAIFDLSPNVVAMMGKDGMILDINKKVHDYTGYRAGDIIGKNLTELDFIPAESRQLMWANFHRMVKGEKIRPYEIEFLDKKGNKHFASILSEAMTDDDDEVIAAVAVLFDITEQKLAEQGLRSERDRARMYFESAGVIFLVLGRDQTIQMINKKGSDILGYGKEELMGKNWFDNFLPPAHKQEVQGIWKTLMQGDTSRFESVKGSVLTKFGEKKMIFWNNALLRDENGHIIGILSSGVDITEREEAEKELKKTILALKEFKDLTVGRENRMIELKKEINRLSEELGRPKPYDISFSE